MFDYPQHAHERCHGPRGYNDYRSFKPWLRDEFAFRCVYCLWRKTWCAAGDADFSVEHLQSQSRQPDLDRDYTNLVYACCGCNSAKQDHDVPLDPCRDALATHVTIGDDGIVTVKTAAGQSLIDLCLLNRQALVSARQTMVGLWNLLETPSRRVLPPATLNVAGAVSAIRLVPISRTDLTAWPRYDFSGSSGSI